MGCAPSPEPPVVVLREITGSTMGTTYTVKIVSTAGENPEALSAPIQAALEEVDALMSTYREESEISALNRWREVTSFALSQPTMEVLRLAEEISVQSGGAFDVTIAPLVNAWGFGPDGRTPEPPTEAEVADLRPRIGYTLLELADDRLEVRKAHPELTVDLSAIAKGFGVDRVAEALNGRGVADYMIEVGGEVRTRGTNALGGAWRIAIERPDATAGPYPLVVPLRDQAMATSGDYRNYYEVDGVRLSHTIDPRTGSPIRHDVTSVSVVDASCARADGLATALLVLGPEGVELAEDLGVAAFFLARNAEGGFDEITTPALARILESPASVPPEGAERSEAEVESHP